MSALQSAIELGRPADEVRAELRALIARSPDGAVINLQPSVEAAARRGDVEILKLLHDVGAGCTHAAMTEAIRANSVEVAKFMLACNMHINLLEGLWLHYVRARMEGRPVIARCIQDRHAEDSTEPFHFDPPKKRECPVRLVFDLLVIVALAVVAVVVFGD